MPEYEGRLGKAHPAQNGDVRVVGRGVVPHRDDERRHVLAREVS